MRLLFTTILSCLFASAIAQDAIEYKTPPKDIYDLVMAKPSPSASIDDKGQWMLIMERSAMPAVEEMAQPELRIAGLRINPNNFGPSRQSFVIGLKLKDIATGKEFPISGLPQNLKAGSFSWSPSDKKIAFTQTENNAINLYVIDVTTKQAKKINRLPLNAVLGNSFDWYDDNTILYVAAQKPATAAPKKPLAPKGPVVQQNLGKIAASVTYQDLIKSPFDEQLFEFYATSQLVKNMNGTEITLGQPGIFSSFDVSPDKNYILFDRIDKPFSYLVTAGGFNSTVFVSDKNGRMLATIDKLPSEETRPSGYDNVLNAPRAHAWVASMPATLAFIEPLDSGLIKKKMEFHDALYFLAAPFDRKSAVQVYQTRQRMGGVTAIDENQVLISEYSRVKHNTKLSRYNLQTKATTLLFDRSTDDAYNDPGAPIYDKNKFGRNVPKLLNGNTLLLRGSGASAEGDMPFLRTFNIDTKETKEIWRCKAPYYESVVAVLDFEKMDFVTSRQSQTEPPNYFMYTNGAAKQITGFLDPQPMLRGVSKQKVTYKRQDGVDLAFDLYLPKGYDKDRDGRLPVLIWAYPREFKSSGDAAQVRGSKYTFVRTGYGNFVPWVTQGYAILDNAEFPIVGEGDKQPNDTYVEQLVWDAEAALNKIYDMGIGDTSRAAVGGHSYGAFMTANLLGHTNKFRAGVARSGAYNRTLTPFGFQNEERTYWQAPDLYYQMSPFSFADKIKTPLLMVHGEADNNPGTFPIQSERLYNAVKGHGGIVRLVMLPFESHGYAAKENILHLMWEQNEWLDKWVKKYRK